MRIRVFTSLLMILLSVVVFAGDFAGGSVEYKVDLSAKFTEYKITEKDRSWANNLAKKFKYRGKVVFFAKTTIPVFIEGKKSESYVYRSIDMPEYFYVVEGDAMLKIGSEYAVSPGVGGFSMSSPKSRGFIVCFNCFSGGVPFKYSSPIKIGKVEWRGSEFKRF